MRAQVKVTPIFLSIELDSLEFEHIGRERERERENKTNAQKRALLSHTHSPSFTHSLSSLSLSLSRAAQSFFHRPRFFVSTARSIGRSIDRKRKYLESQKAPRRRRGNLKNEKILKFDFSRTFQSQREEHYRPGVYHRQVLVGVRHGFCPGSFFKRKTSKRARQKNARAFSAACGSQRI